MRLKKKEKRKKRVVDAKQDEGQVGGNEKDNLNEPAAANMELEHSGVLLSSYSSKSLKEKINK